MTVPSVRLYVDVVSPFAYEAFHILRHDAAFGNVEVQVVPIFLGGLMHACGNTAPIHIKNKDKWIGQERLRWARAFDVPMSEEQPANFPPNTLATMRALCALWARDQALFAQALEALFREMWVKHAEVARPDVFTPVLQRVLGEELARQVLAEAATTGKTLLKENTDRAFADGAFGLPWMVCTNSAGETQGYWGVDHFGQVLQHLGIEKPRQGGWKSAL